MGDTRPRAWEAGESSRDAKTPRLDLLAETALEADELGWEQWPEATGNNGRCNHVPTDDAHKDILSRSLLSDDAGDCVDCHRGEEQGKCRPVNSRILVCLECGRQSCGDSDNYVPFGHAQDHARQEQHWVAAMFADPQAGFCFSCGSEVPVYPEQEEMSDEIQAGGHAFGFDVHTDLVSGLLNLGGTWHGHEFRSANVQGYAIRGIPNWQNTCYVNAILQCLLVLDKLRARMLGPDAPPGQLGLALKELFVEASAADAVGGMLGADKFLRSIRVHADKYQAYKMHDSHELLESFRNALHKEVNEIETPNRKRGDPTVIDYIFRGKLSYTRSCVYCGSSSVVHEHFYELSLALTAMEHSSSAVPETRGSLKSQPKNTATQLIPANEKITSEKIQAVPESSDFHILSSEMKDDVREKTHEPLEVDSSEAQRIWQVKDVVQDPLLAEDKVSCSELIQGIIGAPSMSVSFVPHNLSDVKVEQVIEVTTDSHGPEELGPLPLVSLLGENGASMASGSYLDQNDNANPGNLLNQLEVSKQAKENTSEQFTAEDKGNARSREVVYDKEVGISDSVPSIEDCLSLFFKKQAVVRNCDDCPKALELSTSQSENSEPMAASTTDNSAVDGNQIEQSDRLACQTEQSIGPNSLPAECKSSSRQSDDSNAKSEIIQTVEANTEGINSRMSYGDKEIECCEGIHHASSCLPSEIQTNLLSMQHSQNLSTPNQDRRKQVGLDISARQLGDNQNEQKETSGCSIETPRITKLPPVLTLHLKRYINDGNVHKSEAHVSYKEYLDLGQFMDTSSVDKDKSLYHLAGVVEHIGGPSMDAGHYVAYVRARRLGNQQQQINCSYSWFCADDSCIREVTLDEVLKREAYILFYEKLEG